MSDELKDELKTDQDGGTAAEVFETGDFVVFVGRAQRREKEWLRRLVPGNTIKLKGEEIDPERLIGLEVGSSIVTPLGESYLLLKPTLAQRIMNMPRQAQIIYPKDLALILFWADVRPGGRVVEIGVGHGAMTMSLVRAVGRSGRVTSYEIRPDFAERTANNVRRYLGDAPWWEIKVANPAETGLDETDVDAAVVDMPTPWEVVPAVAAALKPAGTATFFVPTVPQVMNLTEALNEAGCFAQYQTMEAILRPWRVMGLSVRPELHISGHTGFIINCRRKLDRVTRLERA